ncbi:MAG: hypothetical protein VKJ46_02650 [Leptolyngbyaceae bacterium]|nr:hypothetical protein [Leptolyngbyaceae bacterium]
MHQTYRAILQDSHLTWLDSPPTLANQVEVYVTVTKPSLTKTERGKAMATALAKLAKTNSLGSIDPVAWQKKIRQDRALPGRTE